MNDHQVEIIGIPSTKLSSNTSAVIIGLILVQKSCCFRMRRISEDVAGRDDLPAKDRDLALRRKHQRRHLVAIEVTVAACLLAASFANWPELVRRLDQVFETAGLRPIVLGF